MYGASRSKLHIRGRLSARSILLVNISEIEAIEKELDARRAVPTPTSPMDYSCAASHKLEEPANCLRQRLFVHAYLRTLSRHKRLATDQQLYEEVAQDRIDL